MAEKVVASTDISVALELSSNATELSIEASAIDASENMDESSRDEDEFEAGITKGKTRDDDEIKEDGNAVDRLVLGAITTDEVTGISLELVILYGDKVSNTEGKIRDDDGVKEDGNAVDRLVLGAMPTDEIMGISLELVI